MALCETNLRLLLGGVQQGKPMMLCFIAISSRLTRKLKRRCWEEEGAKGTNDECGIAGMMHK